MDDEAWEAAAARAAAAAAAGDMVPRVLAALEVLDSDGGPMTREPEEVMNLRPEGEDASSGSYNSEE